MNRPLVKTSRQREAGHPTLSWRILSASLIVSLLLALVTFGIAIRFTQGLLVWSDGLAYFLYARSAVVDGDLDITHEFEYLDARFPRDFKAIEPLRKWSRRAKDGSLRPPWPAGAGIVMAPFYALGYGLESIVAWVAGRYPDSYGLIPQFGFALGSVAFAVLGFWCTVLLCSEVGGLRSAHLASAATVFCGPLIFFVLFHPSMAHASSFGLVAMLSLVWLRCWKHGASVHTMVALGLLLGTAATVRYQNALFGILPAALALKEARERGILASGLEALAGAAACCLPIALLLSGQLNNSAIGGNGAVTAAGYPIDLRSPYFAHVLFSCRHGAFHWAPVLGMGVLGLLWASAQRRGWALVLVLAFVAHVYLIGGLGLSNAAYGPRTLSPGWLQHWDGAPSFGMRYLTECSPIFAIGLSHLMETTGHRVPLYWWTVALVPFAVWNGLLILAYGLETITRSGCLPHADMLFGIAAALREVSRALF